MKIELIVHRNQQPRTRHEVFNWKPGEGGHFPLQDLESGHRIFTVGLTGVIPVSEYWWSLIVELRVQGPRLCEPRPGLVFGRPADVPTVVYFPSVAPESNPTFGGWFTVSMRMAS